MVESSNSLKVHPYLEGSPFRSDIAVKDELSNYVVQSERNDK